MPVDERHRRLKSPEAGGGVAAEPHPGERVAKRIARAGLCSRREAEQWITAGRVAIDGAVILRAAINVGPQQIVSVDGNPLPAAGPTRLWLYHKPKGLLTTSHDPQGRATIFDRLPAALPRVVTVGRLDLNSEGLLLLTNDGELARTLEHPETGWARRYRVRAHGQVSQSALDGLKRGVTVDGMRYGPIEARLEREGPNSWLAVSLREGKNREVRRVLESIGLTVNRLIRVAYGPFQLGSLAQNAVKEVPEKTLSDQLKRHAHRRR